MISRASSLRRRGEPTSPVVAGAVYPVRVERQGSALRVFRGGDQVAAVTDTLTVTGVPDGGWVSAWHCGGVMVTVVLACDTLPAASRMAGYEASGAFAGPYLADQLLLPFALAGGGAFTTVKPSQHMLTAVEVIDRFLGRRFSVSRREDGCHLVSYG